MPRLNGNPQAAGLSTSAGLTGLAERARWALDKATGGGIGRSEAVPFTQFADQHLPQLRAQTAAALAATPGLGRDQQADCLSLIMTTVEEAYTSVCAFQAGHADSLGRRSAARMTGSNTQTGVGGVANFRMGGNQNLWNKHDVKSPFMQAAGGQMQALVQGLLSRVSQEARDACTRRVIPSNTGAVPPLHELVGYAKAAAPESAGGMPFVPTLQCSTLATQLAKDHLVACVLDRCRAQAPA